MSHLNLDTDLLRELQTLRELLAARCVPDENGCLLYPRTRIMVRLAGYHERMQMSPARVAWALAHPESHLGPHDFAVHICKFAWSTDTRRVCCHPDHLRKGAHDDIRCMTEARRRQLILQGR